MSEWFSALPDGWESARLKSVVQDVQTGVWGSDPRGDGDDIVCVRVADFERAKQQVGTAETLRSVPLKDRLPRMLQPGDILLEKSGGTDLNPVGFSVIFEHEYPAVSSNFISRIRVDDGQIPKYWLYALAASYATRRTERSVRRTTGIQNLDQTHFFNEVFPKPPPRTQVQIADYLDRETAQIDTLIEEQERLIDLLIQRRVAVAEDLVGGYVGRGERLKWSFREQDERLGTNAPPLPLLSVSISWGVRRRDQVTTDAVKMDDLSNYKVCSDGHLVINRMRAFQGALGLAREAGIVSPDYAVLEVDSSLHGPWLEAMMRTPRFVFEMTKRLKGIGSADLGTVRTPRINMSDLASIPVAIPSHSTQRAEAEEVFSRTSQINALVVEAERFIELSKERRSALITAAVTGQITIPGAA